MDSHASWPLPARTQPPATSTCRCPPIATTPQSAPSDRSPRSDHTSATTSRPRLLVIAGMPVKGGVQKGLPLWRGFAPKVATGTVVRQAHHERSFRFTVPPELVEGRLGPLDTSCANPFGGGLGVSPSSLFFPLPGQEGGQGDGRKGASAPSFG